MSANAELAAAVRRLNALREHIPAAHRPPFDVEAWNDLNRRVAKARSENRAREFIAAWERDARHALSGALANAPSERDAA